MCERVDAIQADPHRSSVLFNWADTHQSDKELDIVRAIGELFAARLPN